ncbi:DNA repair protein RecN [Orbus sturtevantii]|uniref:DNA repair protein RecN n=1 Tax=Orbus sturtevantii TaxID=3074109 RepID=UPI00370D74B0
MLTQLTVNNFAIVDNLIIDFYTGMTAITGETGAGKSISVDALGLCLGARSDIAFIRHGSERTDISAHFLLDDTPSALEWLINNQLDDDNECILRRVINQDGRSKAFINGISVPASQLKELGQMLIQIHGQHEHQQLMRSDYQQRLLDQYMAENSLLSAMKIAYKKWKLASEQYAEHEKSKQDRDAHIQLLQYQLKELNEFSPIDGEYQQIDDEYKRLSNSGQLINLSSKLIDILEENTEFNLLNQLSSAKNTSEELANLDSQLVDVSTMLEDAAIQIKEAGYELRRYIDNLEVDPAKVIQLEQRISKQISLARKHHVAPQNLPILYQQLLDEFEQISKQDELNEQLLQEITQLYNQTLSCAKALHTQRVKSASVLSKKITKSMQELAMPHGQFNINIQYDETKMSETGADHVTYLVTTNPGQPLQPMSKVASGGELSRIALAIQVLTAQKIETPALIFDEIDVGISGATAAKVGNLLRELGQSTQVITVTHLPQVAGNAHHHYFVSKQTDGKHTQTQMNALDQAHRLKELARLLGGDKITENTLANAKDLLINNE